MFYRTGFLYILTVSVSFCSQTQTYTAQDIVNDVVDSGDLPAASGKSKLMTGSFMIGEPHDWGPHDW